MFLGRFLGERVNVLYYTKYKIPLTYNYTIYWTALFLALGACLLPLLNIHISNEIMALIDIVMIPISIICYYGLIKIENYKLIYKGLNTKVAALNSNQGKEYSRQAMVDIKEKDKKIDERKLKGKKGYDLFNTIFFERHKEILLRSAKWFATISIVVIIAIGILMIAAPSLQKNLNNFLE